MDKQEKMDFLKTTSICRDLRDYEINVLAEHFNTKLIERKKSIFWENEDGFFFYIIVSGCVKITKANGAGDEVILTLLREKDFFGEMSVIDSVPTSASAIASTDVTVLAMPRSYFMTLIQNNPTFSFNMLKAFTQRLRETDRYVKSLFLDDAQRRILVMLNTFAEKTGFFIGDEVHISDLPKQSDLASLAGTSRETFSRIIKKFELAKIIKRDGKKVIIPDYTVFRDKFIVE